MPSPSDDEIADLKRAGAAHVRFNAPLSADRAIELADQLGHLASQHDDNRHVVDLGCGRGALAALVAQRHATVSVLGIDLDPAVIHDARELHGDVGGDVGIDSRLRFEVGDASRHVALAAAACCVGSSHAFGGPRQTLEHLRRIVTNGAVLGEPMWATAPSDDLVATFGELPHGADALTELAQDCGWRVTERMVSTAAEWDHFEGGWCDGVEGVGTETARSFAAERRAGYRNYRAILGFTWLYLTPSEHARR